VAKQSVNVEITALSADTSNSKQNVVKQNIGEEQKLIYLYYIKIGSPPPEDWHDRPHTKTTEGKKARDGKSKRTRMDSIKL
jgi:hypothetical protein